MPYLPGALFYLRNEEEAEKNYEEENVCGKMRWVSHDDCRAANFY